MTWKLPNIDSTFKRKNIMSSLVAGWAYSRQPIPECLHLRLHAAIAKVFPCKPESHAVAPEVLGLDLRVVDIDIKIKTVFF